MKKILTFCETPKSSKELSTVYGAPTKLIANGNSNMSANDLMKKIQLLLPVDQFKLKEHFKILLIIQKGMQIKLKL